MREEWLMMRCTYLMQAIIAPNRFFLQDKKQWEWMRRVSPALQPVLARALRNEVGLRGLYRCCYGLGAKFGRIDLTDGRVLITVKFRN